LGNIIVVILQAMLNGMFEDIKGAKKKGYSLAVI
jgi:hypothetical protein